LINFLRLTTPIVDRSLCWVYNEVAVLLRLCDWPIRKESIAQRLVRLRFHCRSSIRLCA